MTLGLYLLRAAEMGLSIDDLDRLEAGDVYDMLAERANDAEEWPIEGTGDDRIRAMRGG